jgi:hypothetical protein
MIALHVLVEREQLDRSLEKNSKLTLISGILLVCASLVRFFGTASGSLEISYLRIAALLWFGAFFVWFIAIVINRFKLAKWMR